jgi:hypothetical protein
LELTDTRFGASVLSEFRARLAADDQAERLLHLLLARLRERGLLMRGGRQRTDATHVLAAARELNRLELVTETLRAALEALVAAAPRWLTALVPDDWYARYGQRARDWRLPKGRGGPGRVGRHRRHRRVRPAGSGLRHRRARVAAARPGGPDLRAVWVQQYYRDQQGLRWRGKSDLPPGALAIGSPTTPRPATGSSAGWAGVATRPTSPRPASPIGPTWSCT